MLPPSDQATCRPRRRTGLLGVVKKIPAMIPMKGTAMNGASTDPTAVDPVVVVGVTNRR